MSNIFSNFLTHLKDVCDNIWEEIAREDLEHCQDVVEEVLQPELKEENVVEEVLQPKGTEEEDFKRCRNAVKRFLSNKLKQKCQPGSKVFRVAITESLIRSKVDVTHYDYDFIERYFDGIAEHPFMSAIEHINGDVIHSQPGMYQDGERIFALIVKPGAKV